MGIRKQLFRTTEYRRGAAGTFDKMAGTTLRVTGLEHVFERANASNRAVLKNLLGDRPKYESIIRKCGDNPEAIWRQVRKAGGENDDNAVRVIGMSLGNPNAYPHFPPNPTMMQCMRESMAEENDRGSCSYAASYGHPELRAYLQGANLSDPASVNKPHGKFKDVRVLITAGGSQAAHYAMGPAILKPEHAVAVHDWIYVIHLGAAYYRGARVKNFELRNDGVPDPKSLGETLDQCSENGAEVKCVVCTTIGNPIGSATPREVIIELMETVKRQSVKDNRPIIAFFDTAYEAFRPNGDALDPIEIALDEGIEVPVGVFETSSKGHGLCGMRLGALRMWWPTSHFSSIREDYFSAMDYLVQPTLGLVPTAIQKGLLNYLMKVEMDAELRQKDVDFLKERREKANANLVYIAKQLRDMSDKGVYLATYYDHGGELDGIDPATLSSFYIGFGFDKLQARGGSAMNQAQWLGGFCLENGLPVINAVPGTSFLPEKRWPHHSGLIRVTGLTGDDDTEAFLETVAAAAEHLAGKRRQIVPLGRKKAESQ